MTATIYFSFFLRVMPGSFASWKQRSATWPQTQPHGSYKLNPHNSGPSIATISKLPFPPPVTSLARLDAHTSEGDNQLRTLLPWRPTRPSWALRRRPSGRGGRTRCSSAPWRCTTQTPGTGGTTWRATWAAPSPSTRCAATTSCSSATSRRSSPAGCRSTGTPPRRRRRRCSEVTTNNRSNS